MSRLAFLFFPAWEKQEKDAFEEGTKEDREDNKEEEFSDKGTGVGDCSETRNVDERVGRGDVEGVTGKVNTGGRFGEGEG